MNKKFIRVLGLGVGLFLAGSLSVNAQKVSFNGERLSLTLIPQHYYNLNFLST